jgi:hypothetical protein
VVKGCAVMGWVCESSSSREFGMELNRMQSVTTEL